MCLGLLIDIVAKGPCQSQRCFLTMNVHEEAWHLMTVCWEDSNR